VQPLLEALPTAVVDLRNAAPRAATAAYPRSHASTARYLQWNMDAGAWRRVARLLGPLPPLFTSVEPWLDGRLGGESLRAAIVRARHWRMQLVGTQEAGTFDRVDTPRTSRRQVRGGGGGLCGRMRTRHHPPPSPHARAQLQECRTPRGGICARRRMAATLAARAQ
jgi:hypothetical protein